MKENKTNVFIVFRCQYRVYFDSKNANPIFQMKFHIWKNTHGPVNDEKKRGLKLMSIIIICNSNHTMNEQSTQNEILAKSQTAREPESKENEKQNNNLL